jgi:hypothetical protein
VTAVVPTYRCGAAPESHRIPSCDARLGRCPTRAGRTSAGPGSPPPLPPVNRSRVGPGPRLGAWIRALTGTAAAPHGGPSAVRRRLLPAVRHWPGGVQSGCTGVLVAGAGQQGSGLEPLMGSDRGLEIVGRGRQHAQVERCRPVAGDRLGPGEGDDVPRVGGSGAGADRGRLLMIHPLAVGGRRIERDGQLAAQHPRPTFWHPQVAGGGRGSRSPGRPSHTRRDEPSVSQQASTSM